MSNECPKCGSSYPWIITDTCTCREFWYEEYLPGMEVPEDWQTIHLQATTLEQAAEAIHEKHFADWDYQQYTELMIKAAGTSEWKKFEVTVETVPSFNAKEVKWNV